MAHAHTHTHTHARTHFQSLVKIITKLFFTCFNNIMLQLRTFEIYEEINQSATQLGKKPEIGFWFGFVIIPSLSTNTRSPSIIVGIRWAIVITVQSLNSVRSVRWMILSVMLSTDAVASSRMRIRVRFNKARLRQTSWRCPALQFSPFSPTTKTQQQKH